MGTFTKTLTITAIPSFTATSTVTPAIAETTANVLAIPTATPSSTQVIARIDLQGHRVVAFPNPAKTHMTFAIKLEESGPLVINIYNLLGEKIARLEQNGDDGTNLVPWNCGVTAPGIYLVQVVFKGREIQKLKTAITR